MGLFDWLKGSTSRELVPSRPESGPKQDQKAGPKPKVTVSVGSSCTAHAGWLSECDDTL